MATMRLVEVRVRLAGVCWVLTGLYFGAQVAAQAAWSTPFSLVDDRVSDLGNTRCEVWGATFVCSPLHGLMNAAFVATGALLLLGLVFGIPTWPRRRLTTWGLAFLAVAGAGTVLVGLAPENENVAVHVVGALNLPCGNVAMILLGLALRGSRPRAATLSVLLGAVGLVGLLGGPVLVILTGHGGGLAERVALYPLILWAMAFGIGFVRSPSARAAGPAAPPGRSTRTGRSRPTRRSSTARARAAARPGTRRRGSAPTDG